MRPRGRRDRPAPPVSGHAVEDVHDGGGTFKAPDLAAPALPARPRLRPRRRVGRREGVGSSRLSPPDGSSTGRMAPRHGNISDYQLLIFGLLLFELLVKVRRKVQDFEKFIG